jgi:hypothetical protein
VDLLAGSEDSPAIWRHGRLPHRVEFFNPKQKRFADAMPAVQNVYSTITTAKDMPFIFDGVHCKTELIETGPDARLS